MSTKVLLDPGHGGRDPGAVGPTGLRESDTNLAICLALGRILSQAGLVISYTRTGDTFPSINDRINQANNSGVAYFISVHCNSDGPTAVGIETLVFASGTTAHRLGTAVNRHMINATGDRDRGVKIRTDLGVLRSTRMPAILPEVGFISHPATEAKLRTDSYRQLLAGAIAAGTAEFLGIKLPGNPEPVPPGEVVPLPTALACPYCAQPIVIELRKG